MSQIRDLVNGLDSAPEVLNEQKELIEALSSLAEARANLFRLEIEKFIIEGGSGNNLSIPVEGFIDIAVETHAYSSDNADEVTDRLTSSIKSFIDGGKENVLNGIGTLLGGAVQAFLGSGEAGDNTLEKYVVYSSGLGIERLDLRAWKRTVTASGIKTKVETVTAFTAVRSAVDLTKVKLNTFLIVYARQLKAMGLEEKDFDEAISEAKEIYRQFQDSVSPISTKGNFILTASTQFPG